MKNKKKKKKENEIAKKELLELCYDEYQKNNKSPNVYYIYKWIMKNPNEKKEIYEEKKKELLYDDWLD